MNHVESLHLSARDDRLGDVLYLSVFGALSSSFTIGADDHAAGGSALGHGEEGALLALSEPSASAVAVSWAAAVPPEGVEPASISYELLLAEHAADKRVPVLFTQCGIDESARPIGNLTGRDADREGVLSSKLKKLQPGTKYQVRARGRGGRAAAPERAPRPARPAGRARAAAGCCVWCAQRARPASARARRVHR